MKIEQTPFGVGLIQARKVVVGGEFAIICLGFDNPKRIEEGTTWNVGDRRGQRRELMV